MDQPRNNPGTGSPRSKLNEEQRNRICASCRRLSEWGRLYRLVTTLNDGHWSRGPAEQSQKTWPSAPGWENVKRGFKHSLPIAEANYLEFFDEDHQVGRVHEAAVEDRNERFPNMSYAEYKREHLKKQPGVLYMPDNDRDRYKIRFNNGRLVLPDTFPVDVKLRLVQHSQQLQEEDDQPRVPGQPRDKPKHRVIFVADEHDIYITVKEEGRIQHSSFLRGRPAFMAGYFTLREYDGTSSFKITKIKGKSGHYRPDVDQFVVFLWALELMLPLRGVHASYAVIEAGQKSMNKVDAAELLEQHRGRVIPEDAPEALRFQLEITQERPATPRQQQQQQQEQRGAAVEADVEADQGAGDAAVDEETALLAGDGRRRRRRCCGSCGCVIM